MGRQSVIVLDTHALLWWVTGSARLSTRARRELEKSLRQGPVAASAISLFEISTAVRRGRLDLGLPAREWLAELLRIAELRIEPVDAYITLAAGNLADSLPGDPADRIIAATAISLRARLVTADARLRKSPHVESIW